MVDDLLAALGVVALLPGFLYAVHLAQEWGLLDDIEDADPPDWPI